VALQLAVVTDCCRQALYDERTKLISELYQRLSAGHATGDAGPQTASSSNHNIDDDDNSGLRQTMSIRKGLLLLIRLIPLLNQVTRR